MKWIYINPVKSGNYIVETKTKFGNRNVMTSYYNAETGKWSFSNQSFYRYIYGI